MTKKDYTDYMKAVDTVCLNCIYKSEKDCQKCLVRKSVDYHIKERLKV